jgi:hypothetical protein
MHTSRGDKCIWVACSWLPISGRPSFSKTEHVLPLPSGLQASNLTSLCPTKNDPVKTSCLTCLESFAHRGECPQLSPSQFERASPQLATLWRPDHGIADFHPHSCICLAHFCYNDSPTRFDYHPLTINSCANQAPAAGTTYSRHYLPLDGCSRKWRTHC